MPALTGGQPATKQLNNDKKIQARSRACMYDKGKRRLPFVLC
ncbi:hypothetical protein BN1184_BU_00300 [Pantoea ananatis]|nr:hypothetical protein BN1184_BU_00300 [Pantoea ananatis]